MNQTASVAIIGGGMAGLACATELAKRGVASTVFDKGRGPGGRMATRRANVGETEVSFDHGAQYFTARDPAFVAVCDEWQTLGVIAPWAAAGSDVLVGRPGMNEPVRHMAETLDVRWGERVESISRHGDEWRVTIGNTSHNFAQIVVAVPAEQAAVLLAEAAPETAKKASASESEPCWAIMAAFGEPLDLATDVLRDRSAPIRWAARNGAKPGREGAESWVIHASPEYSRAILEQSPEEVSAVMLAHFFDQAGIAPVEPIHCAGHRWRFAKAPPVTGQGVGELALWNADSGLGVAGDWLVGPRVESAFLSGHALAKLIAHRL
jgi:renalase